MTISASMSPHPCRALAAHALAHDAVLVTSKLAHFERIPDLAVEDWLG